MAGEPVRIELRPPGESAYVPVATGTTGSDGHFTITTTLPSGGYVSAVFAGDADLAPSRSTGWTLLQAAHLPSRFVLDPAPASVPAGTPVTFSGTMQVRVDGDWQPFAGAPLTLTMEPGTSSEPAVTYATTSGDDGRFSLTEPVGETYVERRQQAASVHRTSSKSSIEGRVTDWYDGQVSFSSLRGLKVRLYYRARGSKTWHAYRTATLGRDGAFSFSAAKGKKYYFKVVFPTQGAYRTSTSRTL
ncbi:hypothetical protein [Actinoallomurus sp. NPDC052274]|uniref:hypothetical protein n=1 Tax=Actinoallomurus sp. NPDC052274 TaxID=3155420 RepID=UPI003421FDD5